MKKLALALALVQIAACSGVMDDPEDDVGVHPPPPAATLEQARAFARLEASTHQRWTWKQDAASPALHLAASRKSRQALVVNAGSDPVYASLSLLAAHQDLFNMRSARDELASSTIDTDGLGMTHARFQQTVRGVPVAGAELMVHYDAVGHVTSIDSNYVPGLELDVAPALSLSDARAEATAAIAVSTNDSSRLEADEGKLVVFPGDRGSKGTLAYEFRVRALESKRPAVWVTTVDAATGAILHRYDNLQTVQGSGVGFLGDTKTFEVTANGDGFVLVDASNGVQIRTLTARQEPTAPGRPITSNTASSWDTGVNGAGAAVDAHVNAAFVFKYYKEKHGRNAIDGAGGAMLSTVHYGTNFENAAWDSVGMFYGDGGTRLRPFSVSLDVVGHEFTHGVIEKTSKLVYENEPGALNEAFADIMGAFVEHSVSPDAVKNWQLGEAAVKVGPALRDMMNPAAGDDPQPAHMSKFVVTTADNGGVHINSGIINNAAYLMTVGGTNPVSNVSVKAGIGWEKSEKLWYRANAQYFLATTNFRQAAQGLLRAAEDMGLNELETWAVDCSLKATGLLDGECGPEPATIAPDSSEASAETIVDPNAESAPEAATEESAPRRRRMSTSPQAAACSASPGAGAPGPVGGALLAVGLVALMRRRRR